LKPNKVFFAAVGWASAHHLRAAPTIQNEKRPPPAQRQETKVFWFFSSEKNKTLLFLKKKKQKDFYSWCCLQIRPDPSRVA
jgi:hypothetical protein